MKVLGREVRIVFNVTTTPHTPLLQADAMLFTAPPLHGRSNSQGDRYSDVCSGCVACSDCDVADSTDVPTCTNVLDNTQSAGNTIVLETILIDSGYWRATPSSRDILACHNPDACLGGETGAADYCAEGYEGPCTSTWWRLHVAHDAFPCYGSEGEECNRSSKIVRTLRSAALYIGALNLKYV